MLGTWLRPVQLVEARCVNTFQNDQVLEFQDCTDTVSVSSNLNLFLTNTQLFISQDVNWWTEVVWITCRLSWCFYQLFGPSFWRHPFTAEDQLVNKRCNAKFLQLWSHEKWWPLGEFIFSKLSFLGELFPYVTCYHILKAKIRGLITLHASNRLTHQVHLVKKMFITKVFIG